MTIHEIKRRVLASDPDNHFFDRASIRFFHQTMKSFSVVKGAKPNTWVISAPMVYNGVTTGATTRLFDGATNTLQGIKGA